MAAPAKTDHVKKTAGVEASAKTKGKVKRELIIMLGDTDAEDETIIERVLELVSQGYTSGYGPWWEIKETKEPQT